MGEERNRHAYRLVPYNSCFMLFVLPRGWFVPEEWRSDYGRKEASLLLHDWNKMRPRFPGRHPQVTSVQLWMLQLMAAHIVVAEHNVQICTRHMWCAICRFCRMCHIAFTLHVYDLTFISGVGRDGSGVIDEMAARLVTTVCNRWMCLQRLRDV